MRVASEDQATFALGLAVRALLLLARAPRGIKIKELDSGVPGSGQLDSRAAGEKGRCG